jgi:hypothetical protein
MRLLSAMQKSLKGYAERANRSEGRGTRCCGGSCPSLSEHNYRLLEAVSQPMTFPKENNSPSQSCGQHLVRSAVSRWHENTGMSCASPSQ